LDGQGDACDGLPSDFDGDGEDDSTDNCPFDANPVQADADADGDGDVCDNCPFDVNSGQDDADGDGYGDACDNCPSVANPGQDNIDLDASGDACDGCPNDPAKIAPGACGCGQAEGTCGNAHRASGGSGFALDTSYYLPVDEYYKQAAEESYIDNCRQVIVDKSGDVVMDPVSSGFATYVTYEEPSSVLEEVQSFLSQFGLRSSAVIEELLVLYSDIDTLPAVLRESFNWGVFDLDEDYLVVYSGNIVSSTPVKDLPNLNETLLFIDRIKSNVNLLGEYVGFLLPFFESNKTTYAHVAAFFFNDQKDPLAHAKRIGYVKENARMDEWMTRAAYIEFLRKVARLEIEDMLAFLKSNGIISSEIVWGYEGVGEGIPLPEFIKVANGLQQLLLDAGQRVWKGAAEEIYENNLSKYRSLHVGDDLIDAYVGHLLDESAAKEEKRLSEEKVTEYIASVMKNQYGQLLTSGHIKEMRKIYFEDLYNLEASELEVLEGLIYELSCENISQTGLPSSFEVGGEGLVIGCGGVGMGFTPGTTVSNWKKMPEFRYKEDKDRFALEISADYQDTIIVDHNGESRVKVIQVAENVSSDSFMFGLYDRYGLEITSGVKKYYEFEGQSFMELDVKPRLLPGLSYFLLDIKPQY